MAYTTAGMVQSGHFGYGPQVADTPEYIYVGARVPIMPDAWRDNANEKKNKVQNIALSRQITVDNGHTQTETWYLDQDQGPTHTFADDGPIVAVWQGDATTSIKNPHPFTLAAATVFDDDTENPQLVLGVGVVTGDPGDVAIDGVCLENTNDTAFNVAPLTYAYPAQLYVTDPDNDAFPGLEYKAASAWTTVYLLAHAYNFIAYQNRNCRSWPLFGTPYVPPP